MSEVAPSAGPVAPELVRRILGPYKPNCRYVQSVEFQHADGLSRATAQLGIAESCYIEDTGHFNAVEFNLCYNQIIYVLLGQCVLDGALEALNDLSLEGYLAIQLPDVLIRDFRSVFRRPIDPRTFRGEVGITAAKARRGLVLVKTEVRFTDPRGGLADGAVSLAIVRRSSPAP